MDALGGRLERLRARRHAVAEVARDEALGDLQRQDGLVGARPLHLGALGPGLLPACRLGRAHGLLERREREVLGLVERRRQHHEVALDAEVVLLADLGGRPLRRCLVAVGPEEGHEEVDHLLLEHAPRGERGLLAGVDVGRRAAVARHDHALPVLFDRVDDVSNLGRRVLAGVEVEAVDAGRPEAEVHRGGVVEQVVGDLRHLVADVAVERDADEAERAPRAAVRVAVVVRVLLHEVHPSVVVGALAAPALARDREVGGLVFGLLAGLAGRERDLLDHDPLGVRRVALPVDDRARGHHADGGVVGRRGAGLDEQAPPLDGHQPGRELGVERAPVGAAAVGALPEPRHDRRRVGGVAEGALAPGALGVVLGGEHLACEAVDGEAVVGHRRRDAPALEEGLLALALPVAHEEGLGLEAVEGAVAVVAGRAEVLAAGLAAGNGGRGGEAFVEVAAVVGEREGGPAGGLGVFGVPGVCDGRHGGRLGEGARGGRRRGWGRI